MTVPQIREQHTSPMDNVVAPRAQPLVMFVRGHGSSSHPVGSDVIHGMNILWFIIIGIIAGWIAGVIMKGRGFGVMGNLIVGAVGAVIGGFIFDAMNIAVYGTVGSLAMAVLGAIVLLGLTSVIKRA